MRIYPFRCIYNSSVVTKLKHAQHGRQDCVGQKERESLKHKNTISHIIIKGLQNKMLVSKR